MGLTAYAGRRTGDLSQGNAQRLGLAKALLHNPKLLLLDEPANGLDPAGIVEVRELLLELTRDQGVTVFMSSHILAEVARLAGRIGIIHLGRLLQELDVEELERNRRRRLLVRARDTEAAWRALAAAGRPGSVLQDGAIELTSPAAIATPDEIARRLVRSGVPPTQLVVEEEELEHYFLRLIGSTGGAA
jgi:ABC-2 type transport system ATP-binding protein